MSEKTAALEVLKASAGSGKTFTLVCKILTVLLQEKNPHYYKHVLALTFTNAAAHEMKERVIETLEVLSDKPEDSPMLGVLLQDTHLKVPELKYRAQKIIKSMLHNYSDLSIMTIDSFTHKLVRSFAQELDLRSDFSLEFDQKELLNEGVDQVMSDIGFKKEITQLIKKQVLLLVQESDKWNLDKDLKNEIESLISEQFLKDLEKFDEEELGRFIETVKNYKSTYEKEAAELLQGIEAVFLKHQLSHDDFSGKKTRGFKNKFEKHLEGKSFEKIEYNPDSLFTVKQLEMGFESVQLEIVGAVERYNAFTKEFGEKYLEARIILDSENLLKLSKPVLEKFSELKDQQNVVFINDFHKMIYEMVRNEPAPFIFEKIGVRYKHFFLDEFQDTSVRQWSNLSGLVHDGISQDHYSLIVGDAKQSIYRWREGKVEQFVDLPGLYAPETDEEVLRDKYFRERGVVETLGTNYRSRSEVISFNNDLFARLSRSMDNPYIEEVFTDVFQNFSGDEPKRGGYVRYEVREEVNSTVKSEWAFEVIQKKLKAGFKPSEICLLLRSNADIQKVTIELKDILNRNGLTHVGIYSSESYTLQSFAIIRLLNLVLQNFYQEWTSSTQIAFMQFYIDSANEAQERVFDYVSYSNEGERVISFDKFKSDYNLQIMHNEGFVSLYHLVEEIILRLNLDVKNHPAVQLLLDEVLNYGRSKTAELYGFLKYYDESLHRKKVETTPSEENIIIQTVHKSKGLQYPIVLIPGVDYKISKQGKIDFSPVNWAESPLLRVNRSNKVLEMEGGEKAKLEEGFDWLENLNLLYVACTRAVDELYMLGKTTFKKEKKKDGSDSKNGVGDIQVKVNELLDIPDEETLFSVGEPVVKENSGSRNHDTVEIESYRGFGRGNIAVHATKELTGEVNISERGVGVYFHELMQLKISGKDDEVGPYLAKTNLDTTQKNDLLAKMKDAFLNEDFKKVLGTPGTYLLEKAILTPDGKSYRPDLVKLCDDSIVIIDYKTGVPSNNDVKQVEGYKNVLKQMYPAKSMTGYIYYVSLNEMRLA